MLGLCPRPGAIPAKARQDFDIFSVNSLIIIELALSAPDKNG
jgi:hypothetical protein